VGFGPDSLARSEPMGEGFDSDAAATLPVGVKHEKPVSPWLNRPYK